MSLSRQQISTFYQGVSRQPDYVRLSGHVQDSVNAVHSVVSGGFYKRPGTIHINELSGLDPDKEYGFFSYSRDESEAYLIALGNSTINIFSLLDGTSRNVDYQDTGVLVSYGEKGGGGRLFPASYFGTTPTVGAHSNLYNDNYTSYEWGTSDPGAGVYTYSGGYYSAGAVKISSADIYPSLSSGFTGAGDPQTITVRLYGKATLPANATDGTLLGSASLSADQTTKVTIASSDTTTSWSYVWVAWTTTGSGGRYLQELVFNGPTNLLYKELVVPNGITTGTWKHTSSGTSTLVTKVWVSDTGAFTGEETYVGQFDGVEQISGAVKKYVKIEGGAGGAESDTWDLTVTYNGPMYLETNDPRSSFRMAHIADVSILANRAVTTRKVIARTQSPDPYKGKKQKWSELPTSGATLGDIWRITGQDSDSFSGYLVKLTQTSPGYVWEETSNPNESNSFHNMTLPHKLTRNANGSFTFSAISYSARAVGDSELLADPEFVDDTINGVTFHRDRLVFISGENVDLSAAGDYYSFYPSKALDVLDSDPFSRTAGTSDVNVLSDAINFRRALFLTSTLNQFELSGDNTLTPKNAKIELATSYRVSSECSPYALGDTLYMAAQTDKGGAILEYYWQDSTISNTAADVTLHVESYLKGEILQIAGDTVTGTLFVRTDDDLSTIYVYKTYWEGVEKKQSAWFRWTFDDAEVRYVCVIGHKAYLVLARGDALFLESVSLVDEFDGGNPAYLITSNTGIKWPVRLDRRQQLTGTYSAVTGLTSWTSPQVGEPWSLVLGDEWSTAGAMLVDGSTDASLTASGDYSAHPVIAGVSYETRVKLSKMYPRGENAKAIVTGRWQLKTLFSEFQNSGFFKVLVTPFARDPQTYIFNGRNIGSAQTLVGKVPLIDQGSFRCPLGSLGSQLTVEYISTSHIPFSIVSATIWGDFIELTLQEGRSR